MSRRTLLLALAGIASLAAVAAPVPADTFPRAEPPRYVPIPIPHPPAGSRYLYYRTYDQQERRFPTFTEASDFGAALIGLGVPSPDVQVFEEARGRFKVQYACPLWVSHAVRSERQAETLSRYLESLGFVTDIRPVP